MIRRLTVLIIASTGMTLCIAQGTDESLIHELLRVQTEAWNHGDGAGWAKDFTNDCDFINIRGDVFQGRRDLGTRVDTVLHGPFKGSHLSLSVRRFTFLTPEVALIETDHEVTGFPGMVAGIEPTADGVLRTHMKYVAAKRNGRWYFVAAQNTAVSPSQAPH